MKIFFMMGLLTLTTSCINNVANHERPLVNPEVKILNSAIDRGITYIKSPVIQIDALNTQNANNTVVVMGDSVVCQDYQKKRCQGRNPVKECLGMTGYFLDFKKVQNFNLSSIPETAPLDVSVYHTNGSQRSECVSFKFFIDTKKVDFSSGHTNQVTRNPLLSPKLTLSGPDGNHCKGEGIEIMPAIPESSVKKIEIGVGSTSNSPNVLPYFEIDKTLKEFQIPMTGLIVSDNQRFYTFVRVTDAAGNINTKMIGDWRYTLEGPKQTGALVTLDNGSFGFLSLPSGPLLTGNSPREIDIIGKTIEISGKYYFFGKIEFGTKTHLFKFDPTLPIGLINPMNLTLGLEPLPVFKNDLFSHEGIVYFIGDNKLLAFNPLSPVSNNNPYPVEKLASVEVDSFAIVFNKEIYLNGTDTVSGISGVFKFSTTDSLPPTLYTDEFRIENAISNDGCNIYAQSGASLEDVIYLKIFETIDTTSGDPDLLNPKVIISGPNSFRGPSFIEDKIYFSSNLLPYKFSELTQLSSSVNGHDFLKCDDMIFGTIEDSLNGRELGVLDPSQPLSGVNPGVYADSYSGLSNGLEKMIGCGIDNQVYFTGRLTGDPLSSPTSVLRFNPKLPFGASNPQKVTGGTENLLRELIPLPSKY